MFTLKQEEEEEVDHVFAHKLTTTRHGKIHRWEVVHILSSNRERVFARARVRVLLMSVFA